MAMMDARTGQPGVVATRAMCAFCFDVLFSSLTNSEFPPLPKDLRVYLDAGMTFPMFVTWNRKAPGYEERKFSSDIMELRGCIGSLSAICPSKMKDYAMRSAFQDSRFRPISSMEVPLLECKISLLHSFESGKTAYDWQIGQHGIIIEFRHPQNGQTMSATYLPEVAKEHRMDHKGAVSSLVRKAGYRGEVDSTLVASISLTRYQSTRAALTHDEYVQDKTLGA
eukprot:GDKH01005303.1.p1 GENE.GDKH01005303.1~~GDKH01005303.1.p1  ORF type:complete len:224 (+),score=18.48 GDKH01005303.1:144-815(+)